MIMIQHIIKYYCHNRLRTQHSWMYSLWKDWLTITFCPTLLRICFRFCRDIWFTEELSQRSERFQSLTMVCKPISPVIIECIKFKKYHSKQNQSMLTLCRMSYDKGKSKRQYKRRNYWNHSSVEESVPKKSNKIASFAVITSEWLSLALIVSAVPKGFEFQSWPKVSILFWLCNLMSG